MSSTYCSSCLQGGCRQHPNQDHGIRVKELKSKLKSSQIYTKTYDELIQNQLNRLMNENRGTSQQEINEYKEKMEYERELAMKKKRKKLSEEHERLALTTGLSGAVLSAMIESEECDEENMKKKKKRKSNSSDEESSNESERKSRKKSKKSKKKKDKKSKKLKKKSQRENRSSSNSSSDEEER